MAHKLRRIAGHPIVKIGYFALLVGATVLYLVRWGDRLPDLLRQMQALPVILAFLVICLSSLLYVYIQYAIYRRLGAGPSYRAVFRIVGISQLGKYLPGKVLFAGNFYLLSRAAGIGNLQIGAAFTLSMALWILTASLCALPVLALLQPALRYSVLVLPLLLALLIHPRILGLVLGLVQRVAGRLRGPEGAGSTALAAQGDLLIELNITFYLQTAFLYLATWALAGLGAWLSASAFAAVGIATYPLALASIALGTVAGFLALFAPVGLGIREGIGALVLSPAVGADVALLAMVLLRGVTVVVDLLFALIGLGLGRGPVPEQAWQDDRAG
jgi:hypothetical protein